MIEKGPLQVEGVFQVQISVKALGVYVPLPDLVHEKSEISLAINKPARHTHVFSTANLSVVDGLIKDAVLEMVPRVRVRIGLAKDSGTFWFPWQNHILLYTDLVPNGKGYLITLVTGDTLEAMDRTFKTRHHHGPLSDIVHRIASDNSLQAVIEPTAGVGSYIQSNETDPGFIQRIMNRAVNLSGAGGFRYYIQDNVLHFHTLDYMAVLRTADVFSLSGSKVVLSSRVQDAMNEGGSGVRIVGIDTQEGVAYSFKATTDVTPLHGNQAPNLESSGPLSICAHPSWNKLDDVKALPQSMYAAAHVNQFHCILTIEKGYPLQVNDLVQVQLQAAATQQSPWSGMYSVQAVTHIISRGASSSVLKMQRGEFFTSASQATASGALTTSEFSPHGRAINIAAVASSVETKGPVNTFTGGRTVKVVQPVG